MIPKMGDDCIPSNNPCKMRPITLLPEINKIISRVLAKRLAMVLQQHPQILAESQRGFIPEGGIHQCLEIIMSAIEDNQHKVQRERNLLILKYDQQKAYDSVQLDTIKATLDRFALPERFIQIIMMMAQNMSSRVVTPFGLGETIKLVIRWLRCYTF